MSRCGRGARKHDFGSLWPDRDIGGRALKRYFRRAAESGLGPGLVYVEFEDDWATRQVEVYDDRWFCSIEDYHPELGPRLVDQPLSELDLGPEHEISAEDFENAWAGTLTRCRAG